MNFEPELKYYTIADLRQWLLYNKPKEGLSDKIIAPQRAYAIMNNPFVADDDVVLCAIFEDGEPAAYTAAFPEVLEYPKRERIWWFTTLYCRPESTGKGYGLIVVGTLAEIYGVENCFDMDGAYDTIEIFKHLGHKCSFVQRHEFGEKHINTGTFKGLVASSFNDVQNLIIKIRIKFIREKIKGYNYTVSYSSYVDDQSYDFIIKCSQKCCFVRKQVMFNWIQNYPFVITSPSYNRVKINIYISFSSNAQSYNKNIVNVYSDDIMIGLFMYRIMDNELSITYLYYLPDKYEIVFLSILEHFINLRAKSLKTTSIDFSSWFQQFKFTNKFTIIDQSFSYPSNFFFDKNSFVQQGDGDAFV